MRTIKGLLLEMKLAPTSEERILAEEQIVLRFFDMRSSLEDLTNAALADLKPLPSQVERAFNILKDSKQESR